MVCKYVQGLPAFFTAAEGLLSRNTPASFFVVILVCNGMKSKALELQRRLVLNRRFSAIKMIARSDDLIQWKMAVGFFTLCGSCTTLTLKCLFYFAFATADVLSEEAVLKWYKESHSQRGWSVFNEQMKKFVEWLEQAEEGECMQSVVLPPLKKKITSLQWRALFE